MTSTSTVLVLERRGSNSHPHRRHPQEAPAIATPTVLYEYYSTVVRVSLDTLPYPTQAIILYLYIPFSLLSLLVGYPTRSGGATLMNPTQLRNASCPLSQNCFPRRYQCRIVYIVKTNASDIFLLAYLVEQSRNRIIGSVRNNITDDVWTLR